jgi:hypothetical protein
VASATGPARIAVIVELIMHPIQVQIDAILRIRLSYAIAIVASAILRGIAATA